ncbi:VOC family protein [Lipingzhangella sp. LS1_29]|uniref:VOC family protein n=1 Tax=Lipingzhangella rawalii TaxID=2055835 RepID=A0ABU2H4K7_9ACTN|nr:VOC family protein [Lipingzhangella rawalii]MDS1270226.1 VOC family protein [Lipingzhangella rawalii]
MLTTDPVPGTPSWLDIGSPDVDATAAFYHTVLGWDLQTFGAQAGGYGIFRRDGAAVAAVGPLEEEGARSAWMLYFHTPDVDAAAASVRHLGGSVRVAPGDVGEEGRMAQFSDPLGGRFAVWQPNRAPGLELVNRPGALSWTELMTPDPSVAARFYGDLFGWHFAEMPMPDGTGTYRVITSAGGGSQQEQQEQGGIVELAAEHLPEGTPYWHPVFNVGDCDSAAALASRGGGDVVLEPQDVTGVGRMAVCHDLFGAEFVVLAEPEG